MDTDGHPLLWMGSRLSELTGLDSLNIDQTTLVEHSAPAYETPDYRAIRSRGWVDEPVVLLDEQNYPQTFGRYRGHIDLHVGLPPTIEEEGRPGWMRMHGYRHRVPLQAHWMPTKGVALLQAFRLEEREACRHRSSSRRPPLSSASAVQQVQVLLTVPPFPYSFAADGQVDGSGGHEIAALHSLPSGPISQGDLLLC